MDTLFISPKHLAWASLLFILIAAMMTLRPTLLGAFSCSRLAASDSNYDNSKPLRFAPDGTFQLAVFEDLHFGEAEDLDWGPEQDVASIGVMNSVLYSELSVQLAVLNGDLITGENTYLENSTLYIDQIVAPLVERNLAWASTYGNHDSDLNISREGIFEREQQWPNSLTQHMVTSTDAGVTNYYLPIISSDTNDPTPAALLWFFDSRGGNYFQSTNANGDRVPQPNWVDPSVVSWFRETNAELTATYGKVIPSISFYHIPVNAMLAFQQRRVSVDAHRDPGINADNPLAQQGVAEGASEYEGQDIPFMEALLDTKGLVATFSGHDHGDDWCFTWDSKLANMTLTGNGLHLCFGRHSGYGGYGSWMRGSRQIVLNEATLSSGEVETWVRLEDGSVTGSVTLNSTYGHDRYPAVPEKHSGL